MTRNEAEEILKEHGQEHVLRHFDDLSAEAQEGLLTQISEVNWDDLAPVSYTHLTLPTNSLV